MKVLKEFFCSGKCFQGFPSVIFGSVTFPPYEVMHFPTPPLRIQYICNFVYLFSINFNRGRGWLFTLRESIFMSLLEQGNMENIVDSSHGDWKLESVRVGGYFRKYLEGSGTFRIQFLHRSFCFDITQVQPDFCSHLPVWRIFSLLVRKAQVGLVHNLELIL